MRWSRRRDGSNSLGGWTTLDSIRPHMIIARTSRLILRQFCPDDAEAMASIFGDAEVMRYGDGVRPLQWVRSWIDDWLDTHYATWGFGAWAVVEKRTNGVIAYCGLSRFPGRCAP